MPTTIPSLTPYADVAPQRGIRATFRDLADKKVAHDYVLLPEANTSIAAANLLSGEVYAKAADAFAARDGAVAAQDAAEDSRDLSDAARVLSQEAAASAAQMAGNIGAMLGINFGGWQVVDGELVVSHLSTTTPSITDGELIIDYEAI